MFRTTIFASLFIAIASTAGAVTRTFEAEIRGVSEAYGGELSMLGLAPGNYDMLFRWSFDTDDTIVQNYSYAWADLQRAQSQLQSFSATIGGLSYSGRTGGPIYTFNYTWNPGHTYTGDRFRLNTVNYGASSPDWLQFDIVAEALADDAFLGGDHASASELNSIAAEHVQGPIAMLTIFRSNVTAGWLYSSDVTFREVTPQVPLPGGVGLLASGLIVLGGLHRHRRRKGL
ncbi:hypothetical protein [Pseudooceanicola sp.]|uniref:hypothetical protein n=1 Tax=Pseudooceanicola sp. TaxID=1914328 RepID=UPI0035C6A901